MMRKTSTLHLNYRLTLIGFPSETINFLFPHQHSWNSMILPSPSSQILFSLSFQTTMRKCSQLVFSGITRLRTVIFFSSVILAIMTGLNYLYKIPLNPKFHINPLENKLFFDEMPIQIKIITPKKIKHNFEGNS